MGAVEINASDICEIVHVRFVYNHETISKLGGLSYEIKYATGILFQMQGFDVTHDLAVYNENKNTRILTQRTFVHINTSRQFLFVRSHGVFTHCKAVDILCSAETVHHLHQMEILCLMMLHRLLPLYLGSHQSYPQDDLHLESLQLVHLDPLYLGNLR